MRHANNPPPARSHWPRQTHLIPVLCAAYGCWALLSVCLSAAPPFLIPPGREEGNHREQITVQVLLPGCGLSAGPLPPSLPSPRLASPPPPPPFLVLATFCRPRSPLPPSLRPSLRSPLPARHLITFFWRGVEVAEGEGDFLSLFLCSLGTSGCESHTLTPSTLSLSLPRSLARSLARRVEVGGEGGAHEITSAAADRRGALACGSVKRASAEAQPGGERPEPATDLPPPSSTKRSGGQRLPRLLRLLLLLLLSAGHLFEWLREGSSPPAPALR